MAKITNLPSLYISILIYLSLTSCYTTTTTDIISEELVAKKYKVGYYQVTKEDGKITSYNNPYSNYTILFNNDFTVEVNTSITVRDGKWATFNGMEGTILQMEYPLHLKDVWQLGGNWVIIQFSENTMVLRQENIEMMLYVIK
jgi:hypothetical protein